MSKEVILTGLRANNVLHVGNYLGAILPMVSLQQKLAGQYQMNMFVPDLHSFTTPIDHDDLYENSLDNLKVYMAAGLDIDNKDTFIYRQSYIPAHSELTWVLDCFTYFGEMGRMIQFKEKAKDVSKKIIEENTQNKMTIEKALTTTSYEEPEDRLEQLVDQYRNAYKDDATIRAAILEIAIAARDEINEALRDHTRTLDRFNNHVQESIALNRASVGLFNYPVLMAADILLYSARWVPVGDDQRQHVEITRDIAERINEKFKAVYPDGVFTLPEPTKKQNEFIQLDSGLRIRDLLKPEKKMSKSDETGKGVIFLNDDPEVAAKKVMSAATDSMGQINFDWDNQPGVTNLLQMLSLLSGRDQAHVNAEWTGKSSYGELKQAVAGQVKVFLNAFQAAYNAVDESRLLAKLQADESAMNQVANAQLLKVQRAVGLRPRE